MPSPSHPICVAALYQFTELGDLPTLQQSLSAACAKAGVKGTILLAPEGINGTIAGSDAGITEIIGHISGLPGCAALEVKYSRATEPPFHRMKVRLKREIVTLGQPHVDPVNNAGTYVAPEDWNALIADPDTILIDTRNDYEVAIGTFEGALDPKTQSFRDFPAWFRDHKDELNAPKVAMFCTGGIRCEKATAFLKSEGIDDVFHLKGGILKYLETIPEADSKWHGECFVFDERVSVRHGLEPGDYQLCRACRMPLNANDLASPDYEPGVACPHCKDTRDAAQRKRYAERQRQVDLAAARGQNHIGDTPDND